MIECEYCKKKFASYEALKQHHSTKHPSLVLSGRKKARSRIYLFSAVVLAAIAVGTLALGPQFIGTQQIAQENIGPLGSTHIHQKFALYIDNQQVGLSQRQYQLRDRYAHFEGGDGTTLHLHATGITLRYVIETLGISYEAGKTIVDVNGRSERLDYKPLDGDEISVWLFTPRLVVGLSIGNLTPDFTLTDSEGTTITLDTFKGKPLFIFFTTTWCVPCQRGAQELLKYDLETGDDAFNILIVFVDLKETIQQVGQWKDSFGGRDWFTALDTTGMASAYQVRYLDTKYVLDKDGIIRYTDVYPLRYEDAKSVLQPLIRR